MPAPINAWMNLLPGRDRVIFLLHFGRTRHALVVPTPLFLPGLKAACNVMSFADLIRFDDALDEIYPWTGNV